MNIFEQAMEVVDSYHPLTNNLDIAAELERRGLLRSDPPDEGEIMSFRTTGNNSHLIEDCFKLGYLTDDMAILDPTYGMGVFWKRHRPPNLLACDLHKHDGQTVWKADFTAMPWDDNQFDAVVFDPDYKLQGTDSGEGPASSNERYGMAREYRAVEEQMVEVIGKGLIECARVTKPGGVIAVKHMDQVVSGNIRWQTDAVLTLMSEMRCQKFAAFHLEGHRKQPTHDKCKACGGDGKKVVNRMATMDTPESTDITDCEKCGGEGKVPRRQVHERRNYSTLALYRKAKS